MERPGVVGDGQGDNEAKHFQGKFFDGECRSHRMRCIWVKVVVELDCRKNNKHSNVKKSDFGT